jgi:hypothetical protein
MDCGEAEALQNLPGAITVVSWVQFERRGGVIMGIGRRPFKNS